MSKTAEKNNIKPDTILKTFWRDNDHFADLFNAALFDGEQVLNPADLMEVDTDVSSVVKFNNHAAVSYTHLGCMKACHVSGYIEKLLRLSGVSKFLELERTENEMQLEGRGV